jgi:hypothetical protein
VLITNHDRQGTGEPASPARLKFRDGTLDDVAIIAGLQNAAAGALTARLGPGPADALRLDAYDGAAGAGEFYARCGFQERGRVTYKGNPLVSYERLVPGSTV